MIVPAQLILDLLVQMAPNCLVVLHGIRLDNGAENQQSPVLHIGSGWSSDKGRVTFLTNMILSLSAMYLLQASLKAQTQPSSCTALCVKKRLFC